MAKKTKHTAGPWTLHIPNGMGLPSVSIAGESALEVMNVTKNSDECEANARLIAAAPDLLAALFDACSALADEEESVKNEHRALILRMNKALVKARGK